MMNRTTQTSTSRILLLVTLLLIWTPGCVGWAQEEGRVTILLRSGEEVSGTLLDFKTRVYRVRVDGEVRTIPEDEVARILFDGTSDTPDAGSDSPWKPSRRQAMKELADVPGRRVRIVEARRPQFARDGIVLYEQLEDVRLRRNPADNIELSSVVWLNDSGGQRGIWRLEPDGTRRRVLQKGSGLAVSPRGDHFMVRYSRKKDGAPAVGLFDLEGNLVQAFASLPSGRRFGGMGLHFPAAGIWSPSGKRVLIISQEAREALLHDVEADKSGQPAGARGSAPFSEEPGQDPPPETDITDAYFLKDGRFVLELARHNKMARPKDGWKWEWLGLYAPSGEMQERVHLRDDGAEERRAALREQRYRPTPVRARNRIAALDLLPKRKGIDTANAGRAHTDADLDPLTGRLILGAPGCRVVKLSRKKVHLFHDLVFLEKDGTVTRIHRLKAAD